MNPRVEHPPAADGNAESSHREPSLSLRSRLTGGLVVVIFLALFILAVVIFVWERLDLPAPYLYAGLVAVSVIDLILLALFADHRLRVLVLEPVERMVGGAERIAEGDESRRLERSDTVELARLASAVNEMAGRLIRNQQQLAENVASLDATNRELTDARGRLMRADKLASMGRLAAGVAHEIGNPLGAIMGYVELGKRSELLEPEWMEGISHEARRIDEIVRGLLEYARPKAAAARPVDVNEIVSRTVELMRFQGRFKRVQPSLDLQEDVPSIEGDPFQLEQVLVNLLLNAGDAIAETGRDATVRVSTRLVAVTRTEVTPTRRRRHDPSGVNYSHLRRLDQSDDPGPARQLEEGEPAVEIGVHDSGPGIPPADVQRVFDPFYTTKPPGKGTGLGLAVSARLVEGMGGMMEAVVSEDPGATFRILLPVAQEEGE
jgi:signal transduction histidine kinase